MHQPRPGRPRLALLRAAALGAAVMLAGGWAAALGTAVKPTEAERKALDGLRGAEGTIIWHSSRDGDFEIYRMNADGSGKRQLTQNKAKDYFARWSPDGRRIAFTSERNGRPQVFVMNADGSGQQVVVEHGLTSSWTPDGKGILWVTGNSRHVMLRDLAAGKDKEVLPLAIPQLQGKRVGNASFSADWKHIVFYSNWKGYHSANLVDADGGNLRMVGRGCEPSWFPDAEHVVHIKAGAAVYRNNLRCDRYEPVTRIKRGKGCRDHEYFPAVSDDGRYLVWGICPWNQHDHWTADYEIFIMRLPDGEAVRLTFHSATDAWPHMFCAAEPRPEWEGYEARAGWQAVNWADEVKPAVERPKRDDGTDQALRLTALATKGRQKTGKVAVELNLQEDLGGSKEIRIDAQNEAKSPVSLAAALGTGAGSVYFESAQVPLEPGKNSLRIPIAGGSFKSRATGWAFKDAPPENLGDTRRIILLIYGLPEGQSVVISRLTVQ